MKTLSTILLLCAFCALQAQPNTRIDLTELESPPDTSLIYFITTEGDTATYTNDVASIDSTGRVFTVTIGGDTFTFEDQIGTSGTADGVTTSGALDAANTEFDFTVASPGSNYSVDYTGIGASSEFSGWDDNESDDFTGVYTDLDFTATTGLSDGVDDVDDADASASNEGDLSVGAGGANTATISSNTTGSTDVTIEGSTNVTISENTGTNTISISSTDTDTQLSDEQVEDIAGAMFSGNTETLITATYQDTDGTIDLVVDNDLSNYDNSTSGFLTSASTSAGWLKDSIQAGNVTIDGLDNDLRFDNINRLALGGDTTEIGAYISHLVYPDFLTAEWQLTTNRIKTGDTWQFLPDYGTYPYFAINAGSDQLSLNTAIIDSNALMLLGLTNDTPSADGYIGYSSTGNTIAIYDAGAWNDLAWADDIAVASNGLTKTGNDIELGGSLTQNTTITGSSRDLEFASLSNFDVSSTNIGLTSQNVSIGNFFLNLDFPDGTNTMDGSQVLNIKAAERIGLRMSNIGTPSVVLDSALARTTINGAFRVDGVGYFKPQAINNATDPSEFGFVGYSISDTTLFIWDGAAWKEIGSSTGGGGTSGAFSTASNVTSNSPGTLATDDFVFGSDQLDDDGTLDKRFFFDKSKAAFAAGEWTGTEADDANRGFNTTNLSRNTTTSAYASAAIGGQNNRMAASGATAVGCNDCEGNGDYSAHFGRDARSSLEHDVVHGAGGDAKAGHHQYRRVIAWRDFTGTGTAQLYLNGFSALLEIPNNTMWGGTAKCSAVVSVAGTGTSVGDLKFYEAKFYAVNVAGTTTAGIIDDTNVLLDTGGFDGASSSVSILADDVNDAITVILTNIPGSAGSETSCTCTLDITESGY